jgi:hypothetical protein
MGKIKYITLIIVALLGLGALSSESGAAFLKPGMPAPNFMVQSGDNQKLSMDMIRGKVVVLFYESRDAIRKNIELKNELKRLFGAQPANVQNDIFRLVVVDCSSGAASVASSGKASSGSRQERRIYNLGIGMGRCSRTTT